jgi:hypothetical protein
VFRPLVLEAKAFINLGVAKIKFEYSGSDPTGVTVDANNAYTAAAGHLRIWKKNGNQARNKAKADAGGDYVAPGVYTAAQLGLTAQNRVVTLYLEGIAPSTRSGDQRISVAVDPDGDGPEGFGCGDAVRATPVRIELDVNGNKSLNDAVDRSWNYLPGYEGNTPKVSTGLTFNAPDYVGQLMKIVVEGAGKNAALTEVRYEMNIVTSEEGYAQNATHANITGANKEQDFSFKQLQDHAIFTVTQATTEADGGLMEANKTWADFWAKDYGGKATVLVYLKQGAQIVAAKSLRIVHDSEEAAPGMGLRTSGRGRKSTSTRRSSL